MEPYFAWAKFFLCEEIVVPKSKLICRYRICWPVHGLYWVIGLFLCYLTTIIMFTTSSEIIASYDISKGIHVLGVTSVIAFGGLGWLFHIPLCFLDNCPFLCCCICCTHTDCCWNNDETEDTPEPGLLAGKHILTAYIFFIIFSNMYTYIFLTYVTRNIFFVIYLPCLLGFPTAVVVAAILLLFHICCRSIKDRVVEFETNRIKNEREQFDEPPDINIPGQELERRNKKTE
jgi:hypothetical protein